MANQWVRLWIDMPTDPKWRVISKISKQPLTSIISVYVCLLTNAANAMKRGVTQCNAEEIAATLDLENDHVEEIFKAMQGRVLDGEILTGWEKRQPKREDDSRERVSKSRSNKNVTQCNAQERNVTQCNAPDTDTDTDTDTENTKKTTQKKVWANRIAAGNFRTVGNRLAGTSQSQTRTANSYRMGQDQKRNCKNQSNHAGSG
jgi:O6-methylguanine-DNA--protein-cysteine methyltransferase